MNESLLTGWSLLLIASLGIFICGVSLFLGYILQPKGQAFLSKEALCSSIRLFKKQLRVPGLLFLLAYIGYFIPLYLAEVLQTSIVGHLYTGLLRFFNILVIAASLWFYLNLVRVLVSQCCDWADRNNKPIGTIVFPMVGNSAKMGLLLLFIDLFFQYIGLPKSHRYLVDKAITVSLIILFAWLAWQLLNATQKIITAHYIAKTGKDLHSHRLYTLITVIKRIALFLLCLLTLAAIIMVFDKTRELGTTLLASAGIITAGLTLAVQRHLDGFFTGLQLAITQPIRINDTVVVEKEMGYVEEINFNHVIIKTWDLRRLLVPSRYFLDNTFQNWSGSSRDLLGAVLFYVDYLVPIDDFREKFYKILDQSKLWNRKTATLQVTDIKETVVELRLLVSADDSGKLWNLRCEVREQMLNHLKQCYPNSLPKLRIEQAKL